MFASFSLLLETLLVEAVVVVLMFIIWSEVDSEKRLICIYGRESTYTNRATAPPN